MIKTLINDYFKKHGDIEGVSEFIENFFCELKEDDPRVYHKFQQELEDELYEITPDTVIKAVHNLQRKDGLAGEKWTKDEITQIATQYNLASKYESFDLCIFYFAMNYVYAVHNHNGFSTQNFIDIAFDEIQDKNTSIKHKIRKISEK